MNPLARPDEEENVSEPLRLAAEALLSPSLLEAVPDATLVVNQEGIVLQVNSQVETLFGYTRDELIGQPVEVLVPDRQRPQHHHHRKQFTEQPKVRRMGAGLDLYGRRRDGSEFPVEISLSPVSTSDGLLVLSAIRDISDRKRIEEELRRVHKELERRKDRQLWQYQSRLALIVDSSQDAIIGKNLDGIITHWNKGAEHIYGYKAEEVIGKSIAMLAPKERADEIPQILEKIRNGQRGRVFRIGPGHQRPAASECFDLGLAHSRCRRQHHRSVHDCARHHGAEARGGPVSPGPEDGSGGTPGGRNRSRL